MSETNCATQPSVFIATPCYGGNVSREYLMSIVNTMENLKDERISAKLQTISGLSIVSLARNCLVACFLKSKFTHIAFIDADMEFPADAVKRLLYHDVDVVAGVYTKKKLPVEWCHSPLNGAQDTSGLIEAKYAGTGLMVIRRSVFDTMISKNAVPVYIAPVSQSSEELAHTWAFFSERLLRKKFFGEDYGFCIRWRELGGRVWVDPELRLGHAGQMVYRG